MKVLGLWLPVLALFALILSTLPLGPTIGLWLQRLEASPVVDSVPLGEQGVTLDSSSGTTAVILQSGALFVHTDVGVATVPVRCNGVDVASGEVLCASPEEGLVRVDQTGAVLSRTPVPGGAARVARVGRAVAIATLDGALQVLTIDEGRVGPGGRLDGIGTDLVDLFKVDGAVVVVDSAGDLIGVSLSDPGAPELIGTSHVADTLYALTGFGNDGFAAAGPDGIRRVDLSDLGAITAHGDHAVGNVTDVQISNGILMWAIVEGQGARAILNTALGWQLVQRPRGAEAELVAVAGSPPRQPAIIADRLVFVDTRPSHGRLIAGVGLLALLGLLGVVAQVARSRDDRWLGKLGWIALGAVALGWLLADRTARPIEALHILEYGALGALLVRALRPAGGGLSGIVMAVLAAACAALVDETVQFVLPMRSGDLDDVWLDVQAAAIGTVVGVQLWGADRRAPWSLPAFTGAFLVLAIVLYQHVTLGYGYVHEQGDLSFYSRLDLDTLTRIDAEQGEENARTLERTAALGYGFFLAEYSARAEPFLYEMRVHLYRRDRRLETGDVQVACGEERLLQTFFARSYAGTSWQWPDSMVERCEPWMDTPYASPVSEEIMTGSGPVRLWGGGLLGVAFLIGMGVRFRQRERG